MIKDEVLAELFTIQKFNNTLAPKEFFEIVVEAINDYYRRAEENGDLEDGGFDKA